MSCLVLCLHNVFPLIDTNPLLKVVYETDTTKQSGLNQGQIQESPLLWQSRMRMAVDSLPQLISEHMAQKVQKNYKILTEFIQQVQFLLVRCGLVTIIRW